MRHSKNSKTNRRRAVSASLALLAAAILATLAPAPAGATTTRLFKEAFGSAEQPALTTPGALAVEQSSGDLLVADRGANEVQQLTVAATAGDFKLTFGAQTTEDIPFNASAAQVQGALTALSSVAVNGTIEVRGGPGDGTGSAPYLLEFRIKLEKTDVEQVACSSGTTPLSGGSGCSVTTTRQGVYPSIRRFHADGTPAPFAALGTNVIDGRRGPGNKPCAEEAASCDQMPVALAISSAKEEQVAIDESAGPAAGDVYLPQSGANPRVNVFSAAGKYLGAITAAGALNFAEEVCGAAVDASGALYVGDYNHQKVQKYVPSANPPVNTNFEKSFSLKKINEGYPCNLAAGAGPSAGSLFAMVRTGGTGGSTVLKLDSSSGAAAYEFAPVPYATPIALDPASGHVIVYEPPSGAAAAVGEYDASGATEAKLLSRTPVQASGLAVDGASDDLYVSHGYEGNEAGIDVYGPPVLLPTVTTGEATERASAAATLNGTVDPEGVAVGECDFEYETHAQWEADGRTFASAASVPCEGAIPTDSSAHPVRAALSGLAPSTNYEFRLTAANANGPGTGSEVEFGTTALPTLMVTVSGEGEVSADSGTISACTSAGGPNCEGTYVEGATVTLTETPGEGQEFAGWGTPQCDESIEPTCEVTIGSGDEVVSATFKAEPLPEYKLTTHSEGGGHGTIECAPPGGPCGAEREYLKGTLVTLTASPEEGSEFTEWTGACAGTLLPACEVTIEEATDVGAMFGEVPTPEHTLTVNVSGEGEVSADSGTISGCTSSGGPACEGSYEEGATVTLTETPGGGSHFVSWATPQCDESTEATCEVTIGAADEAVAASFEANSVSGPPLSVAIEEGEGTVVSDPAGIECTGSAPHSCTTEAIEEGTVTLTASPAPGYVFKSWKGCDKKSGVYGVDGRQCTIDLSAERSVAAKFAKTYELTLSGSGEGKTSSKPGGALCLPNCTATTASFKEGTSVEVLPKPNKHFHLASWGGDCSGSGSCVVPMSEDREVEATFAEDAKHALSLEKQGGGEALIKTKGPGSVCSYTCSQSTASFYEGEEVLVSWKLDKGTSSLTWTTGAGSCTGTHTEAEGSCTVTISGANELVAELE